MRGWLLDTHGTYMYIPTQMHTLFLISEQSVHVPLQIGEIKGLRMLLFILNKEVEKSL